MKKVTLRFPTLKAMWDFMQTIDASFVHVVAGRRTLTCDCCDDDIQMAVTRFNAVVIKSAEVVKDGKE